MKLFKTLAVAAGLLGAFNAQALLNIPSNGSDGDLVVTNNLVIDLGLATPGNWDTNNSANSGNGVYDFTKWAVVFHYRSVIIQGGATVSFRNHASRAPVVWLVQSNVTVNGILNLNGQTAGYNAPFFAEPGPGGFRGGTGNYASGAGRTAGFGPGGGGISSVTGGVWGYGGSYGSQGHGGVATYGNQSLIPLIGGSGGGGYSEDKRGGGAGAGAILIAASGNLSLPGTIRANGGDGAGGDGGGSGGGIRLVASSFSGNGIVQCLKGVGGSVNEGGFGRIRIERYTNSYSGIIIPEASPVELPDGATPLIWMPTNGPAVRIVSIGGNPPPSDPRAEFGSVGADVVLPMVTNVTVVLETTNVEPAPASTVLVRATPRSNGNYSYSTPAAVTQVVSEDPLVLRWTANVPVQSGYAAIQVKVVRP